MVPKRSAKGPSVILTASPLEKVVLYLGAVMVMNFWMDLTSVAEMGVGLLPMPTNPVMPGVVRMETQLSSSMIMRMSRYPGKIFSVTFDFLPDWIWIFSWVGIRISKTRSSRLRV